MKRSFWVTISAVSAAVRLQTASMECIFRFFKDSVQGSTVEWTLDVHGESLPSYSTLQQAAEFHLGISEDPGNYGHVHLRQQWRTFEPRTRRPLSSVQEMLGSRGGFVKGHASVSSGVAFIIEGGQFMYPGIKVGATQLIELTNSPLGTDAGTDHCSDYPGRSGAVWFDGTNHCERYKSFGWCTLYGGTDYNGEGTAADKCCACGGGMKGRPLTLETLSLQPLLFKVQNFLSTSECDHIIELAQKDKAMLKQSPVSRMDHDIGKEVKQWRTSSQMWLRNSASKVVKQITKRVSEFTGTETSQQEAIQVLRYNNKQFYSAHLDAFDPAFYQGRIKSIDYGHKNRLATLFWYMTNITKGGETLFPKAYGLPSPRDMWECETSPGLKVSPRKGMIILWYNLLPNGLVDLRSLHSGCPVLEGTKWSANKWVWNKAAGF